MSTPQWDIIVLDLTNLAYQPTTTSCEQTGYPKRHVTFVMSERRPAYPAYPPDMDEDEDEDDKPLVLPASRKEFAKEKRDLETDDEPLRRRKGPPVWQDPTTTLEQEVSADSRERAKDASIWGRKGEGEALRNSTNKLSDERNLRDLHLKHTTCLPRSSRRGRLTWTTSTW